MGQMKYQIRIKLPSGGVEEDVGHMSLEPREEVRLEMHMGAKAVPSLAASWPSRFHMAQPTPSPRWHKSKLVYSVLALFTIVLTHHAHRGFCS